MLLFFLRFFPHKGFLSKLSVILGSRERAHGKKHRRSHSAEASYSLPPQVDDSDLHVRDDSGRAVSPDLTGKLIKNI